MRTTVISRLWSDVKIEVVQYRKLVCDFNVIGEKITGIKMNGMSSNWNQVYLVHDAQTYVKT